MFTLARSFLCFARSVFSLSSSSASESCRINEPSSDLASSTRLTVRVSETFAPSSASTISRTSATRVSTSSNSTSSSSTSSPSILVTTFFPSVVVFAATTGTSLGLIRSHSAFFKIRLGLPSPFLRSPSVSAGTVMASARASSTKSLSAFFGMRPRDVTPRDSSSARTSFWRKTAAFASEMSCTSLASRTFFNSILAGAFFVATFFAGAFLTAAFFATTFLAGAFFAGFAGFAGFAEDFLATVFFALFLSALNTATIVLWFLMRSLRKSFLKADRSDVYIIP